ncbi:MAG: DUF2505 family protein [Deltaproteobacteria bacterium]|nr:DUF2505 family protein [Deltaproteobacteria bacterium]
MTTEFSFDHVFRVPSIATLCTAYFDLDHLAAQDVLAELGDRTVVSDEDDGATRKTTWRVTALKPLPMFARPLVKGGHLRYLESMTWRRADDAIDLTVQPEILGGRVQIAAVYGLSKLAEGQIQRRYQGSVSVNITLLSGKIERGILAEFEKSMPVMAQCTQTWLDRSSTSL